MKKIFEIEQLTGDQDATPEREANLSEGFLKIALETYFSPEQFNVVGLPNAAGVCEWKQVGSGEMTYLMSCDDNRYAKTLTKFCHNCGRLIHNTQETT